MELCSAAKWSGVSLVGLLFASIICRNSDGHRLSRCCNISTQSVMAAK
jgi:hypothetical protein